MTRIKIDIGARGKLIEPREKGGVQDWRGEAEFEYLGPAGKQTILHLFKSVRGGYKITVAERDFISGAVHFTGSKDTQREQSESRSAIAPPDYYTPCKYTAYARIFKS